MVIINFKTGQLANRIILFAHFIVNSIEHDYELVNTEFDEYEPYFEATSNNSFGQHPIRIQLIKQHRTERTFSTLFQYWSLATNWLFNRTPFYTLYRIIESHDKKILFFNLNDEKYLADAKTKRVVVQGFDFKDHEHFQKHGDKLREFFRPIEKYRIEIAAVLKEARQHGDVVIGVHIRRGDYKTWANGQFFYDDDVYAEKMLQVQQQMKEEGKTAVFLVCSNETINPDNYPSTLKLFTGSRHFIVDMYSLAGCDGIIAPPSTYSVWASFYGKVPLTYILSKDDKIRIGQYKEIS